jgi:signal transduction histidine kinase
MVFRDGFRVYPYGSKDDDWLDLDRKALASAGYKVNRKQIIGKVDISAVDNPGLNDQTNREGLRESPEKAALVNLLKHILEVQLRGFMNRVDKEIGPKVKVNFDVLAERVGREGKNMRANLRLLNAKYPFLSKEAPEVFDNLQRSIDALHKMMSEAQTLADEMEAGHEQLVHLAGLGLMVEMLAHELNRSTSHALETLASVKHISKAINNDALKTLELQLHTLQKRLRTLDPATTSGRQRKQDFDLISTVLQIVSGHGAEFTRHHIAHDIVVLPKSESFPVHLVKGMVIQIVENLISNATYWLKQRKRLEPSFSPRIKFTIDVNSRSVSITDNGPGVDPAIAEDIFQPFYTTKPPGEGKGLGLYIARELAKYHQATVTLSEAHTEHADRYNTFVIGLPVI